MASERTGATTGAADGGGRIARIAAAPLSRRRLLRGGGLLVGAIAVAPVLAACGGSSNASAGNATGASNASASTPAPTAAAPTVAAPTVAAPTAAAAQKVDTYLTVLTGDMIGKAEWPAFVPADFSVPANSTVTVHVACFDDADDMSDASLVQYTKVSGTVDNTVTVQPFSDDNPNKPGAAKTLSQLDPTNGVSHTLTFTGLPLNVPIGGHGWTAFTIKTGSPATYQWECKVPCGSDPNGQGGAMQAAGYMQGTMTVTA